MSNIKTYPECPLPTKWEWAIADLSSIEAMIRRGIKFEPGKTITSQDK